MNGTALSTARIVRFLEQEPVVWLSTVRPDGAPHLVPIWFWWDGEELLVFSKPDAQKVHNLRENPAVMLALGDAEEDFDVGLVRGHAELLDRPTRSVMPYAHLAKYADRLAALGVDAETYAATYSQVIRIVPERFLGWHGRTMPSSARRAGAPDQSIAEPRRDDDVAGIGEPFSRRRRPPVPRIVDPVRRPIAERWFRGPSRHLRLLPGGGGAPAPASL